jgi:hypothetical protein
MRVQELEAGEVARAGPVGSAHEVDKVRAFGLVELQGAGDRVEHAG